MHFETDPVRVDEAAAGLVGIRSPAAPAMSGRAFHTRVLSQTHTPNVPPCLVKTAKQLPPSKN